ncbi:P-loop containing nucleoside triphosphate hydrolase protein [Ramicandelaber brevisporus]|nr:P-loop containing nucleoside triphosphate hydrolase protein [Ramicandelaber brevisporus]
MPKPRTKPLTKDSVDRHASQNDPVARLAAAKAAITSKTSSSKSSKHSQSASSLRPKRHFEAGNVLFDVSGLSETSVSRLARGQTAPSSDSAGVIDMTVGFDSLNLTEESLRMLSNSGLLDRFLMRAKPSTANSDGNSVDIMEDIDAYLPKPTDIQKVAIPQLINTPKKHIILAAETGSGKTLAYLLPTLQLLKAEEQRWIDKNPGHPLSEAAKIGSTSSTDGEIDPEIAQFLNKQAQSDSTLSQFTAAAVPVPLRRLRRPRVVILVPSRELVHQVTKVAKTLTRDAKFGIMGFINAAAELHIAKERLSESPVDVLVTTPGSLRVLFDKKLITPSEVAHVIIDESDSMLVDEQFSKDVSQFLDMVHASRVTTRASKTLPYRCVFVSATIPKAVHSSLNSKFPGIVHCTTPRLHRAPQKLRQLFVDVSKEHQGNRDAALLATLKRIMTSIPPPSVTQGKQNVERVMIFGNKKTDVIHLLDKLRSNGIPSAVLHRDIRDFDERQSILQWFFTGSALPTPKHHEVKSAFRDAKIKARESKKLAKAEALAAEAAELAAIEAEQNNNNSNKDENDDYEEEDEDYDDDHGDIEDDGSVNTAPQKAKKKLSGKMMPPQPDESRSNIRVLACTDLASRGLDSHAVSHVIMYKMPRTVIDYLHRAGRTARAGRNGRVISLVGTKDKNMAERLQKAIKTADVFQ